MNPACAKSLLAMSDTRSVVPALPPWSSHSPTSTFLWFTLTANRSRQTLENVGKHRIAPWLLVCFVPACAVASVDDEGATGDGDMVGDGDGDMVGDGDGDSASGGVIIATGGSLVGSGGQSTGGGSSGGASSGGSSSGGSASGGAASGGAGSGGAASGGAGAGGSASGGGGGGDECPDVGFNVNSGGVGTTGYGCFTATAEPVNGWGAYNCDGRTITINGEVATSGNINWAGSAPYLVEFSAGTYAYCSFSYY